MAVARAKPQISPDATPEPDSGRSAPRPRRRQRKWLGWLIVIAAVVTVVVIARFASRPQIELVRPQWRTSVETLAASGVVEGHDETTIAADAQGTLVQLFVDENSSVHQGELLARVQDRNEANQVIQLQAALDRARAQLVQAKLGATAPALRGARDRVVEARAAVDHATAALRSARIGILTALAGVGQARDALARARAAVKQAASRRDLAQKTLDRTRRLVEAGAFAGMRLDQDQSDYDVADAALADANAAAASAEDGTRQADLTRQAAITTLAQTQSDLRSATAAERAAQADLDNLAILPLPENVAVAQAQVKEAEAALTAARSTSRNSEIRAPYDGTVTQILCRPGGSITGQGLLRLVETGRLEAKADIDESYLSRLRVGEQTYLATVANPDKKLGARIVRIGTQVDETRGTVQIAAVPVLRDVRLVAGQTIDFTIVTNANARRLIVPATAVKRTGDETDVFVYRDGTIRAQPVTVGAASKTDVAVLSGLTEGDSIARDAGPLANKQEVRVRETNPAR